MDYFFISVLGFAGGVLARSLIPFGWPAMLLSCLLAITFLGLWYATRASAYLRVFTGATLFMLGAIRVIIAPQALPEPFVALLGSNVTLAGSLVADPDVRDTNQHVVVRVERGGVKTDIIAYAPLYPVLEYGEQVNLSGKLEQPAPFATDGGRVFRYDRYLAKDHIFSLIKLAHVEIIACPSGITTKFFGMLYGVKNVFVKGLQNALPEPAAALAQGLLTGGKQGLGKNLIAAFTVSGLVQIVVLSGYNVMIVGEGILKSLLFLPRRMALGFAGIGILAFVIAAGSGSSALRAGIMAIIALGLRAGGRPYDALRGLLLALFLMLIWNPFYLVYDPGFELSFVATLGLVLGTPIVEPYLVRIKNVFLRDIIATTIAAQIFVLPLLLWQTGNLSLVALPANIAVLPIVPLAMALAFVAGIFGVVAPVIAPALGIPAYLLLSYILAVGKYSAVLPFANVILPAFSWIIMIALYGMIGWVVYKKTVAARVLPRSSLTNTTPPLSESVPRSSSN